MYAPRVNVPDFMFEKTDSIQKGIVWSMMSSNTILLGVYFVCVSVLCMCMCVNVFTG